MYNHELTHGAFLLDNEVKQAIMAEMRGLLARSGSAVVGLARPVLARTLTLMTHGFAHSTVRMKKGGANGRCASPAAAMLHQWTRSIAAVAGEGARRALQHSSSNCATACAPCMSQCSCPPSLLLAPTIIPDLQQLQVLRGGPRQPAGAHLHWQPHQDAGQRKRRAAPALQHRAARQVCNGRRPAPSGPPGWRRGRCCWQQRGCCWHGLSRGVWTWRLERQPPHADILGACSAQVWRQLWCEQDLWCRGAAEQHQ